MYRDWIEELCLGVEVREGTLDMREDLCCKGTEECVKREDLSPTEKFEEVSTD